MPRRVNWVFSESGELVPEGSPSPMQQRFMNDRDFSSRRESALGDSQDQPKLAKSEPTKSVGYDSDDSSISSQTPRLSETCVTHMGFFAAYQKSIKGDNPFHVGQLSLASSPDNKKKLSLRRQLAKLEAKIESATSTAKRDQYQTQHDEIAEQLDRLIEQTVKADEHEFMSEEGEELFELDM